MCAETGARRRLVAVMAAPRAARTTWLVVLALADRGGEALSVDALAAAARVSRKRAECAVWRLRVAAASEALADTESSAPGSAPALPPSASSPALTSAAGVMAPHVPTAAAAAAASGAARRWAWPGW